MYVAIVVITLVTLSMFWYYFIRNNIPVPVSPGSRPISGHIHHFSSITAKTKYKFEEILFKLTDPKHGPISHLKFWYTSILYFKTVHTAEVLLKSSTNINKSYDELVLWLGKSVLMLPADQWRHRRKILTPAFHFAILEDFERIMKKHALIMIDMVTQNPERSVTDCVLDITLHTIIETSFGTAFKTVEESKVFFNAFDKIGNELFNRSFGFLDLYDWYYLNFSDSGKRLKAGIAELNELIMGLVKERKKDLELGETRLYKGRRSFLDHMVYLQAEGEELTDDQIVGESNTILFAGHGTTTSTVTFCLYYLCKYPEIQERVYQEIKDHLNGRPFEKLEVASLPYLNMVVKETLRIQPPISSISRKLTEPITVDGAVIAANTHVEMAIWWIHRDPEFWPDPEKFDPERFSVENSRGRNPYAFVPFSAGPRNCIGQRFALLESRLLVAAMVYKFRISTTQELGKDLRRDISDITGYPGPEFRIKTQLRAQ